MYRYCVMLSDFLLYPIYIYIYHCHDDTEHVIQCIYALNQTMGIHIYIHSRPRPVQQQTNKMNQQSNKQAMFN